MVMVTWVAVQYQLLKAQAQAEDGLAMLWPAILSLTAMLPHMPA
jgi:hypothetical protein